VTDIPPLVLRNGHITSNVSCFPSSPVDVCHHGSSISWVAPNYRAMSAHTIHPHQFRAALGLQECLAFTPKGNVMFFVILKAVSYPVSRNL